MAQQQTMSFEESLLPFFDGDQKGPFMVNLMFNGDDYSKSRFETEADLDGSAFEQLLLSNNFLDSKDTDVNVVHQELTMFVIRTAMFHALLDKRSFTEQAIDIMRTELKKGTVKQEVEKIVGIVIDMRDANSDAEFNSRKGALIASIDTTVKNIMKTHNLDPSPTDDHNQILLDNIVSNINDAILKEFDSSRSNFSGQYGRVYVQLIEIIDKSIANINKISTNITYTYKNNSTPEGKMFLKFLSKYDSFHPDAKKFYDSQLNVLVYDPAISLSTNNLHGEGRVMSSNDYVKLSDSRVRNASVVNLFNFENPSIGGLGMRKIGLPLFGECLPLLRKNSKIAFFQCNNNQITLDYKVVQYSHFLRNLYHSALNEKFSSRDAISKTPFLMPYTGGTLTLDTKYDWIPMNVTMFNFSTITGKTDSIISIDYAFPYKYSVVAKARQMFSLNYEKILANSYNKIAQSVSAVQSNVKLEDIVPLAQDGLGNVWKWENGEFLQRKGNSWVKYVAQPDSCYGSQLAKGNKPECDALIQCILSNNSQSLQRCLKYLKNADLWKVAQEDLKNVSPGIVLQFLDRFGARPQESFGVDGTYLRPMSFDTWINTVVVNFDPAVKTAILSGNPHLLTYIKALFTILHENPSILNKVATSRGLKMDESPEVSKYFQSRNITKFLSPYGRGQSAKNVTVSQIQNALNGYVPLDDNYGRMLYNSLVNKYENVRYVAPAMVGPFVGYGPQFGPSYAAYGGQHGGEFNKIDDYCTELIHKLFAMIYTSMNQLGIPFDEVDKTVITKALVDKKKLDENLFRIANFLARIVELARGLRVNLAQINPSGRQFIQPLSLRNVNTLEDAKQYLERSVAMLGNSLINNVAAQQKITSTLMQQVFPQYLNKFANSQ